jgi:hypothetical protein
MHKRISSPQCLLRTTHGLLILALFLTDTCQGDVCTPTIRVFQFLRYIKTDPTA